MSDETGRGYPLPVFCNKTLPVRFFIAAKAKKAALEEAACHMVLSKKALRKILFLEGPFSLFTPCIASKNLL